MKKILSIVIIVIVATVMAVSLTACTKGSDYDYITKKGSMVMGITYYEPMNYFEEGDLVGFDTEFAILVCEKLGVSPKFQVINWDAKFLELNSKSIDCIWNGFTVDEERKLEVAFSQSYLNNEQCAVVKASELDNYTTASSFAGKKGIAEVSSAGEPVAQELSTNYTGLASQAATLVEIMSGASDFTVIDKVMAESIIGKGDYSNLAIVRAVSFEPEEYAIGFRKGSDMAEKVNAIIDELLEDGTLDTLAAKYGVENVLIPKK